MIFKNGIDYLVNKQIRKNFVYSNLGFSKSRVKDFIIIVIDFRTLSPTIVEFSVFGLLAI